MLSWLMSRTSIVSVMARNFSDASVIRASRFGINKPVSVGAKIAGMYGSRSEASWVGDDAWTLQPDRIGVRADQISRRSLEGQHRCRLWSQEPAVLSPKGERKAPGKEGPDGPRMSPGAPRPARSWRLRMFHVKHPLRRTVSCDLPDPRVPQGAWRPRSVWRTCNSSPADPTGRFNRSETSDHWSITVTDDPPLVPGDSSDPALAPARRGPFADRFAGVQWGSGSCPSPGRHRRRPADCADQAEGAITVIPGHSLESVARDACVNPASLANVTPSVPPRARPCLHAGSVKAREVARESPARPSN